MSSAKTLFLTFCISTIFSFFAHENIFTHKFAQVQANESPLINSFFYDNFSSLDKWTLSSDKDYTGEIISITHQKILNTPAHDQLQLGLKDQSGMVFMDNAKSHAISSRFSSLLNFSSSRSNKLPVIIQYEVRTHTTLECSGAYLKLIRYDLGTNFEPKAFNGATPYTIMFGPDKCGSKSIVHFIFTYKNRVSGRYVEHHLTDPPAMPVDRLTHLYTLIIDQDNFEILIDNKQVRKGSLLKDFTPSVIPPRQIDDPEDVKPSDQVDEAKIDDMNAKKPEDQDENAPETIIDEKAQMPKDQLVDEALKIPDPEAINPPANQNVDDDGDYEPPIINNPKCKKVSGCGPWSKPLIPNPKFKGKWVRPMIDNPAYKGEWKPRLIDNPDYFEVDSVQLDSIVAVGLELWLLQAQIEFSNLYVGFYKKESKFLAENVFKVKQQFEKQNLPDEEEGTKKWQHVYIDNIYMYFDALLQRPFALGIALLVGFLPIIYLCCCQKSSSENFDSTQSSNASKQNKKYENFNAENSQKNDSLSNIMSTKDLNEYVELNSTEYKFNEQDESYEEDSDVSESGSESQGQESEESSEQSDDETENMGVGDSSGSGDVEQLEKKPLHGDVEEINKDTEEVEEQTSMNNENTSPTTDSSISSGVMRRRNRRRRAD